MELPWPQIVFLVATSVTLPLHFAIIISIVRRRKLSLFHVMVLSQFISQIPLIILPIFQWSIALLIVSPILQPSYIVTYELRSTLEISIPPSLIALGNIVLLPSSSLLFAACVICYVLIVKYLLQYTSHHSEPRLKRHELRLGAQVAGLVIAFMVQVAYNSDTSSQLENNGTAGVRFFVIYPPMDLSGLQPENEKPCFPHILQLFQIQGRCHYV
ncbi:hypothetical protein GCK32_000960 [Trichostrongylus colubriformis]|uniref:Uncharacterized protein n=1 Tax=Trichostrongylus colubriformis TaxID=6319 RepID=A0AAN8IF14_TRICO